MNFESDTVQMSVSATDTDQDPLTFSASGLPQGLSISPTGEITGFLDYDAAEQNGGSYSVSVTVTDGSSTDTEAFIWTINNTNRAPQLNAISNQSNAEGDTISLATSASDPDGDTPTYSITGRPAGLDIDASGVIFGTIDFDAAQVNGGVYSVQVTVTDGSATDTKAFTWTVTNTARSLHWLYSGSGLGDGTSAANWTNDTVPASGDILVFDSGTGDCDLTGFGTGFLVNGLTTEVGYTGTVKLPSAFNIGASGLQMNAGALEINGRMDLLGDSTWTDGAFKSAAIDPAIINLFCNLLAPVPTTEVPIGKTVEGTFFVKNGKTTTVTNTTVTFEKGGGVTVEVGGEFKVTGTASSNLKASGNVVGTFEVRGKFTVETPNGFVNTVVMELHFEQTGITSETNIKSGRLNFRGTDAGNVVARVNAGKFIIWGGAEVVVAAVNPVAVMVFVPGSWLMTEESGTNRATITGDIVINGYLSMDGAGTGQLRIQGNLTFAGTYHATVDFANMKEDQLTVNGNMVLDGTLSILREGDYQQNKTFDVIVMAGERAGEFAQVEQNGDNYTVTHRPNPVGGVRITT